MFSERFSLYKSWCCRAKGKEFVVKGKEFVVKGKKFVVKGKKFVVLCPL